MALTLTVRRNTPEDRPLVLAAEVVQAGGVIVYPTETLYGIGANALHPKALRRVRKIKRRTDPKPILVIVPDVAAAEPLIQGPDAASRTLMETFWPGPLTLVLRSSPLVPQELTLGAGTIGIRVPASTLCLRLLRMCECPITSTSANLTGQPALKTIPEIQLALAPGVDLYLDAGELPQSDPSTVVDMTVSPPRVLRRGAVPFERLREVIPAMTI